MRSSDRPSLTVLTYVIGGSPPVMSTGLPAAPNGGMNLRNAASRSGGIVISDNLLSIQASDNSTPDPPAPVMMTTFSPFGVGNTGMPRANSSMSRNDRARITPDWLNTSS